MKSFFAGVACLCVSLIFSTSQTWADANATPPVIASHDAFVQPGTTTSATSTAIILKNAVTRSTTSTYNRVGYMRFEYDPRYVWESAALEMVVSGNADGASNNGYNRTYTTFNVDVFAASDAAWDNTISFTSANASTQNWGLNTATWPWSIDGGQFMGTISIPTSSSTVGQTFSLSSQALTDFLNNDADGQVTLFIRRSDLDNQGNLSFASQENTTAGWHGPRLVVPDSSYVYTVAYDINGGGGTLPSPGTYSAGSTYTVESASTLNPPSGTTFAGWNSKSDGTGLSFYAGQPYTTRESLTLYAQYSSDPVITLNENYGLMRAGYQSVPSGVATNLGANPFSRTGYSFVGWTTFSDGTGTSYQDRESITTATAMSLHAQWQINQYTVSYDANSGSGSVPPSETANYGTTHTVATNSGDLERVGHTFDGWNTESDGTGVTYADDGVTTLNIPDADVTLFAKWLVNSYQLSYDANGASEGDVPASASVNFGQQITVDANSGDLQRAGYVFAGWNTRADGLGDFYSLSGTQNFSMPAEPVTLFAQWEAVTEAPVVSSTTTVQTSSTSPDSEAKEESLGSLPRTGFQMYGLFYVTFILVLVGGLFVRRSSNSLSDKRNTFSSK